MMIKMTFVLLVSSSLFFLSCKKEDSPTFIQTPAPKTMTLHAYGWTLDSTYYKMWSDSSWEKFRQTTVVSGRTYVTTINNNGDEYYYDLFGYAGFKAKGQSLVIFDKSVPPLPDTLVFGQQYNRGTTFFYQGYNYTMTYQQTLQDTVSVSVPFGIFNPCLWFKSIATLSASGQSSTSSGDFWLAQGPSAIKQTLNSGITIVMVRGVVNGKGWGMSSLEEQFTLPKKQNTFFLDGLVRPLTRM
jgi:hypothetical protein